MLLTVTSFALSSYLSAVHLLGKAGRQRLNRFLLRFLPQPLVAVEHGVDHRHQRSDLLWPQIEVIADPDLQVSAGLGLPLGGDGILGAHRNSPNVTKDMPNRDSGFRPFFAEKLCGRRKNAGDG